MKITFIGAGSTVFCKNVLGDCLLAENLPEFEIALKEANETENWLNTFVKAGLISPEAFAIVHNKLVNQNSFISLL